MLTTGNSRHWHAVVRHIYCGALSWRHRWTIRASLYKTRSGTSSQCSSVCNRCDSPRSYFLVPVTIRAAVFRTCCSLSVTLRCTNKYYVTVVHACKKSIRPQNNCSYSRDSHLWNLKSSEYTDHKLRNSDEHKLKASHAHVSIDKCRISLKKDKPSNTRMLMAYAKWSLLPHRISTFAPLYPPSLLLLTQCVHRSSSCSPIFRFSMWSFCWSHFK